MIIDIINNFTFIINITIISVITVNITVSTTITAIIVTVTAADAYAVCPLCQALFTCFIHINSLNSHTIFMR